jgi:hypothetical protein
MPFATASIANSLLAVWAFRVRFEAEEFGTTTRTLDRSSQSGHSLLAERIVSRRATVLLYDQKVDQLGTF